MHISASVYINDDEAGLLHDYDAWLEKLAPTNPSGNIGIMIPAKTMPMLI